MIQNQLDISNNDFGKQVKAHSAFEKRERVNSFFIAIPVIAALLNFTFLIFTCVLAKEHVGNPFSSSWKKLYYLVLLFPFVLIAIFPLYMVFWHVFKNLILKVFVATAFAPCVISIINGFVMGVPQIAYGGMTTMIAEGIYFWCLWADIKISVISIKTAIIQLNKNRIKLFKQFTVPLAIFILSLSLIEFSLILSVHFIDNESDDFFESGKGKAWKMLLYLAIACWIYTTECLSAIAYIYGAAIFDQTSIMAENGPDNINYSEIFDRAYSIAFRTSLGTACLGAFIITLVRLLINKDKDGKNDSLLVVILSCILTFIEYLTAQAYVYSAIHGKGLFESGKLSMESFKTSGLEKYFNFVIVDRVLNVMCLSFLIGLGTGIFYIVKGIVCENGNIRDDSNDLGIILCVTLVMDVILFQMFYVVNGLLSGHSACQLAIYVEDPARFKKTHRRATKFEKYLKVQ